MATPRKMKAVPAVDQDDSADEMEPTGPPSDQPFTFTATVGEMAGESLTVPSMNTGPVPNQFKLQTILDEGRKSKDGATMRQAQTRAMMEVTRVKVSGDAFDWLCELDNEDLAAFHQQWAHHSGLTPGK